MVIHPLFISHPFTLNNHLTLHHWVEFLDLYQTSQRWYYVSLLSKFFNEIYSMHYSVWTYQPTFEMETRLFLCNLSLKLFELLLNMCMHACVCIWNCSITWNFIILGHYTYSQWCGIPRVTLNVLNCCCYIFSCLPVYVYEMVQFLVT